MSLAGAALQTLSELGYARTSLREIAQNSEFSHGVLHYYFTDKVDLITYCVRQYKAECVLRYDQIVATAGTADDLVHGFADGLAATLREDAFLHRLWYDLRSQSLFEESFRADVLEIDESLERMIWRIVSRFGELSRGPAGRLPLGCVRHLRRAVPAGPAAIPVRLTGRAARAQGSGPRRAPAPGLPALA